MYTEDILELTSCIVNLEAVGTGSLVCYLVFGYCGKGWKWLYGNGVLAETRLLCQFLTAVLGCRKYKLNILLLKSRALPRVDTRYTVWSKYPIPFLKVFLLLSHLCLQSPVLLAWFLPDHLLSCL